MGKKRHTAKTGDKALYKSRDSINDTKEKDDDDDDPMYDEVDRYNNARDELQQDVLRLSRDANKDSSSADEVSDEENVFDLGIGSSGSSSESEDEDEEDSDGTGTSDDEVVGPVGSSDDDEEEEDASSSSDDEFENKASETDVLNWGKSKRDYYHGDTADMEIGQEIEDAELEEEAGKEVVKVRMEGMSEDDFILDVEDVDDDVNERSKKAKETEDYTQIDAIGVANRSKTRRNLVGLSKKDKIKLMKRAHPELLPLISHFRDEMIRPCAKETLVVKNALFQDERNIEAVGATPAGLQYLLSKAMLQTSTALNVCQYLLLKAEHAKEASVANSTHDTDMIFTSHDEDRIRNHPVISRLGQLNELSEKLEGDVERNVKGLKNQMENLVKVSTVVVRDAIEDDVSVESNHTEESADTGTSVDKLDEQNGDDQKNDEYEKDIVAPKYRVMEEVSDEEHDSDMEEDSTAIQNRLVTEARFSVRSEDDDDVRMATDGIQQGRRRALPSVSGCGDDDISNQWNASAAGRSLASTVNSISQRSKSKKDKTRAAPEMEETASDDERTMRLLDMMDADLGGGDQAEDEDEDDFDAELDDGLDDNEGDDFYSIIKKKSKQKKDYKKDMYAVAPKYPVMEEEVDAERSVGRMIMKNRGLVAHKAKINRNPRVKKREQYRKALIRRKGSVREVRTDEGHKYGGEVTGIKSHLSRSRKL